MSKQTALGTLAEPEGDVLFPVHDKFDAETALARLIAFLLVLQIAASSNEFFGNNDAFGWYVGQLINEAEIVNDWFHKGGNPIREKEEPAEEVA